MIKIENLKILFSSNLYGLYTHLISNGLVLYCHLGERCLNPYLENGMWDEKLIGTTKIDGSEYGIRDKTLVDLQVLPS